MPTTLNIPKVVHEFKSTRRNLRFDAIVNQVRECRICGITTTHVAKYKYCPDYTDAETLPTFICTACNYYYREFLEKRTLSRTLL